MSTISISKVETLQRGDILCRLTDGLFFKVIKVDSISIALQATTGNSICFMPANQFKSSEWCLVEN
ncbi:MAG: hypothetical protein V4685_12400 [Bacteroidota bacterium]